MCNQAEYLCLMPSLKIEGGNRSFRDFTFLIYISELNA
jgi:hypothetical protein